MKTFKIFICRTMPMLNQKSPYMIYLLPFIKCI